MKPSGGPRGGGPIRVVVEQVRAADVPVYLTAVGRIEPRATVAVKPQVGGILLEVHFQEGQEVRRGDLLFTIDPRPYEAALRMAEAVLARDQAQLENARLEEQRYAGLAAKEYASREQYEQSKTKLAALQASVRADQAAVDQARLNLSFCRIRSPMEGRAGKWLVDPGNLVKAGEPSLVVLNQIRPARVVFSLPEEQLAQVRGRLGGTPLPVELGLPGQAGSTEQCTLEFLDNAVDSTTGTIQLHALCANAAERLWPGQFVTVRLLLETLPGTTVVPSLAVQTGQAGQYVFVVREEGTVEQRPVQVGQTQNALTVITEGLRPGEQVVLEGQIKLIPGARVQPVPPEGVPGTGSASPATGVPATDAARRAGPAR